MCISLHSPTVLHEWLSMSDLWCSANVSTYTPLSVYLLSFRRLISPPQRGCGPYSSDYSSTLLHSSAVGPHSPGYFTTPLHSWAVGLTALAIPSLPSTARLWASQICRFHHSPPQLGCDPHRSVYSTTSLHSWAVDLTDLSIPPLPSTARL